MEQLKVTPMTKPCGSAIICSPRFRDGTMPTLFLNVHVNQTNALVHLVRGWKSKSTNMSWWRTYESVLRAPVHAHRKTVPMPYASDHVAIGQLQFHSHCWHEMDGFQTSRNRTFGAFCSLIPMKTLAQVIPYNVPPDIIHSMGTNRTHSKKNPIEVSFFFQLNYQARTLLSMLRFHGLNATVILLANILYMKSCQGLEDAATNLSRTRLNPNPIISQIAYPATAFCEAFFQDHVWKVLKEATLKLRM